MKSNYIIMNGCCISLENILHIRCYSGEPEKSYKIDITHRDYTQSSVTLNFDTKDSRDAGFYELTEMLRA